MNRYISISTLFVTSVGVVGTENLIHIWQVLSTNLGLYVGSHDWIYPRFSSVPKIKFQDSISNEATIASFHPFHFTFH
jgi:hypothetical protein